MQEAVTRIWKVQMAPRALGLEVAACKNVQELRKQTSKCPICRNHVEALLHIKMAQRKLQHVDSTAKAAAAVSSLKL